MVGGNFYSKVSGTILYTNPVVGTSEIMARVLILTKICGTILFVYEVVETCKIMTWFYNFTLTIVCYMPTYIGRNDMSQWCAG